jgi:exopolyphosphatase/guanosine-5'-triphosphate,3'-diphosphate pyrophosphatase
LNPKYNRDLSELDAYGKISTSTLYIFHQFSGMNQKFAIIDLGTNTFHLLIVENNHITHRERIAVKIGMGGINKDVIPEDGIDRALEALKAFRLTIDKFAIIRIYAFGTSAFRNALNRNDVTNRIKQVANIEVDIISGDEEAEFIYIGVRAALDLGSNPNLIMDIGGGSVEFIIGNREKIFWQKSVEIGAQRLLEKFQKHDPITQQEIKELDQYFENTLVELLAAIHTHKPTTLVGSSGTFDTLSEIYCTQNSIAYAEDDKETPLTISSFYSTYKELISKNRAERLLIPGMIEMRVDMIVVACCMIRYLLSKHTFNTIRVSTYALKEGVLASIALLNPPHLGRAREGL